MKYFLNRFREPSSLAGLMALAALFGVPADTANAVVQIVGGVAGVAAILLPNQVSK